MKAVLQEQLPDGKTRCNVCAYRCELSDGQVGICRVRKNQGGEIRYLAMDTLSGVCPFSGRCASGSYCISKPSCNWACTFCHTATETNPEQADVTLGKAAAPLTHDGFVDRKKLLPQVNAFPNLEAFRKRTPAQIVDDWEASGLPCLSMRQTEPSIHVEAMAEIFAGVKERGGRTMANTNGFWTPELVAILGPLLDTVDVGLKASANPLFMRKVAGVPNTAPIFDTIEQLVAVGCTVLVSDIPVVHRDWESDFTRVCEFIANTIPARDFPRLKVQPWAGPVPTVGFGHYRPGLPVEVEGQSWQHSRAHLMMRATDLALGHVESLWVTGLAALPDIEMSYYWDNLRWPAVDDTGGLRTGARVGRDRDALGLPLDIKREPVTPAVARDVVQAIMLEVAQNTPLEIPTRAIERRP